MDERPIPLRAHNVLCLHGFRGEGYSDAFVARMREVADRLTDAPSTEVTLLAGPDTLWADEDCRVTTSRAACLLDEAGVCLTHQSTAFDLKAGIHYRLVTSCAAADEE